MYRKKYIDFRDLEKFNEVFSIEVAVKTTAERLYDKRFFKRYANADVNIKDYLFNEVNQRRTPALDPKNDDAFR